ncbi:hypothetical protein ACSBR2_041760 [Camellia fascicularis]
MADDVPHDGALPEVFLPPPTVEVEEPIAAEAGEAVEDIAADFEAKAEVFAPGPEPKLQLLGVRPFYPATYHPRMHMMAPGGMMPFDDFIDGVPEHILLRKPDSYLFHGVTQDFRSCRGYGVVIAKDWYHELPSRVCNLVDGASFGLLCTGLMHHMASRALLGALVERW